MYIHAATFRHGVIFTLVKKTSHGMVLTRQNQDFRKPMVFPWFSKTTDKTHGFLFFCLEFLQILNLDQMITFEMGKFQYKMKHSLFPLTSK